MGKTYNGEKGEFVSVDADVSYQERGEGNKVVN
jgi:hypothetical protein